MVKTVSYTVYSIYTPVQANELISGIIDKETKKNQIKGLKRNLMFKFRPVNALSFQIS